MLEPPRAGSTPVDCPTRNAGGSHGPRRVGGSRMPVVELDGIEIAYDLVGDGGQPWVLTPGGRFTKEVGGLPEMAQAIAATGRQVVLWDRPNCGASSVVFRGRS